MFTVDSRLGPSPIGMPACQPKGCRRPDAPVRLMAISATRPPFGEYVPVLVGAKGNVGRHVMAGLTVDGHIPPSQVSGSMRYRPG